MPVRIWTPPHRALMPRNELGWVVVSSQCWVSQSLHARPEGTFRFAHALSARAGLLNWSLSNG